MQDYCCECDLQQLVQIEVTFVVCLSHSGAFIFPAVSDCVLRNKHCSVHFLV